MGIDAGPAADIQDATLRREKTRKQLLGSSTLKNALAHAKPFKFNASAVIGENILRCTGDTRSIERPRPLSGGRSVRVALSVNCDIRRWQGRRTATKALPTHRRLRRLVPDEGSKWGGTWLEQTSSSSRLTR